MTILVTGFEPFGQLQVNPSALIVEHLARTSAQGTVCEVLDTEFVAAERRIRELIRRHQPETVVCLGVAASASEIRLERQAANLDDARLPDNAGYQPAGTPIVADGSPTLSATLPLDRMLAAVSELGIRAVVSDDAGRYVCNHVMYAALDEIARAGLSTRCGFIHVPLCTGIGNQDDPDAAPTLALADVIAAVERCLTIATEDVVGAILDR
jgi:pyroglutamyl-peptidase